MSRCARDLPAWVRSVATVVAVAAVGMALALAAAPSASAESNVPTDVVCTTYYPSDLPTGVITGETTVAVSTGSAGSGDSGGSGIATETDVPVGTGVVTDTGVPTEDTGVPTDDSGVPTDDTGVPTDDSGVPTDDTGVPTDVPSGPVTACAEAAGGAGPPVGDTSRNTTSAGEPLARSGDDTARNLLFAVVVLAGGIGLSLLGGRRTARRRDH